MESSGGFFIYVFGDWSGTLGQSAYTWPLCVARVSSGWQPLCHLTSCKVAQCSIEPSTKIVTSLPQFKGRGQRLYFSVAGMSKNL